MASGDIVYAEGVYRVNGTDRSLGLFEVARALQAGKPGAGSRQSLAATCDFKGRTPAYPAGCAVCELEIDAQTGQVLSGSFLDYGISRADDLPSLRVEHAEHPTAGNPLRIKGGGEGGIVPATGGPLPAPHIAGLLKIQEMFGEPGFAPTPINQQVLGQKAGHHHANPVVHPTFLQQLAHPRIHKWISSFALFPSIEMLVSKFA